MVKLRLDNSLVGYLIGKGGENIKRIQKEHHVEIKVQLMGGVGGESNVARTLLEQDAIDEHNKKGEQTKDKEAASSRKRPQMVRQISIFGTDVGDVQRARKECDFVVKGIALSVVLL